MQQNHPILSWGGKADAPTPITTLTIPYNCSVGILDGITRFRQPFLPTVSSNLDIAYQPCGRVFSLPEDNVTRSRQRLWRLCFAFNYVYQDHG